MKRDQYQFKKSEIEGLKRRKVGEREREIKIM